MRAPTTSMSLAGTQAVPSRRNSWWSSSKTRALRCSCQQSDSPTLLVALDVLTLPLLLESHGLVLLPDESLIRRVRGLAADVHALAVVRIGIDVVRIAVALSPDELVGGHSLKMLCPLRRVGWDLAETGLRKQVFGVAHGESARAEPEGEDDQ